MGQTDEQTDGRIAVSLNAPYGGRGQNYASLFVSNDANNVCFGRLFFILFDIIQFSFFCPSIRKLSAVICTTAIDAIVFLQLFPLYHM